MVRAVMDDLREPDATGRGTARPPDLLDRGVRVGRVRQDVKPERAIPLDRDAQVEEFGGMIAVDSDDGFVAEERQVPRV